MTTRGTELPTLDGTTFRSVESSSTGDVDAATEFHYRQDGDEVWASYAGGAIARGFLVGSRQGDRLDFRYAHRHRNGETATGHCITLMSRNEDGLLVLNETWEWESRPGRGTSTLVQSP